MLLATLLVAGSFLASEKLAGIIHPLSLTLMRFVGASLILLPMVMFKRRWRTKILSTLPRALVISLFFSVFFISLFESLKNTTSLNTGTLYTLVPFITALLAIPAFKERMSRRQVIVYFFGAVGACWVIFGGQPEPSFSLNSGDPIFMIGVVSMCCYSIAMKYLYRDDEMIVLVFCTLLCGSGWMATALILTGQPLQWGLIQGPSIWHMTYLILCATLASVYLYQKTTVILGPSRVNAYIYLTPSMVALLLYFIDGVSIPTAVVPGILVSCAATVILQLERAQGDDVADRTEATP
ncbi:DMT family transporter [bacterium AH-315-F18]|nr:DMT family transporter [bacterium AH-315-F18]